MINGLKEEDDKLDYEIDWEFVQLMAARMSLNKDKYPPYNWQKPIDIVKLKGALTRHFVEVMKNNHDDEQENGHLVALALNAMMIVFQIKNNVKD